MPQVPVGLRLDEGLLARIDGARGDVPRARWVARACELALGVGADQRRRAEVFGPRSDDGVLPAPRGEQPARTYRQHVPGPNVEGVRSSAQAKRDVRPVPKGTR